MAEEVTPPAVEGTSPKPAPEGRGKFVIPIIGIGVGAFVAWRVKIEMKDEG